MTSPLQDIVVVDPSVQLAAILGRGRLGTSLASALDASGVRRLSVPARDRDAVRDALEAGADIVLLAVPDAAIRETGERVLAVAGRRRPAVVHLSGALGDGELGALAATGFEIGSFHPFLPFSEVRPARVFQGATIGVHASTPSLLDRLFHLARCIGARPRRVDERGRVLYHAAAVMASSYVVALAARAAALLDEIGWGREEALDALLPLMSGTLENLGADGLPNGLSGPLRRGDTATVAKHVEALGDMAPSLTLRTYCVLCETALELAVEAGLEVEVAERIRDVLQQSAAT